LLCTLGIDEPCTKIASLTLNPVSNHSENSVAWPNQQIAPEGLAFPAGGSPNEVGNAIARFVQKVLAGHIA